MKHRGGADNGRTSPELLTGRREQWSPDEIGEALCSSVLGV
jgi:hypothetical protein